MSDRPVSALVEALYEAIALTKKALAEADCQGSARAVVTLKRAGLAVAVVAERAGVDSSPLYRYLDGLDPADEPGAQIVLNRILTKALAGRAQEERVSFDDASHTVTLDGKLHRVDNPLAYRVYKAICLSDSAFTTKTQIRENVGGCRGDKTIPNALKRLPLALRRTIEPTTQGYYFRLPSRQESR